MKTEIAVGKGFRQRAAQDGCGELDPTTATMAKLWLTEMNTGLRHLPAAPRRLWLRLKVQSRIYSMRVEPIGGTSEIQRSTSPSLR
jgi:hypothetical protein